MTDRPGPPAAPRRPDHTQVELTFIAQRIEQWCPIGLATEEVVTDSEHRTLFFAPGSIFALARWTTTALGTVVARLDILRAVAPGQSYTTVPFVRPGAEILLRLDTWPKVEQALQAIALVRAAGIDPADAAPDYWLHVGNRIAADQRPRPYTRARHAVWKLRRKIAP